MTQGREKRVVDLGPVDGRYASQEGFRLGFIQAHGHGVRGFLEVYFAVEIARQHRGVVIRDGIPEVERSV